MYEFLVGDGWEAIQDNMVVEVEERYVKVCMLSFVCEQNMYPNWMLDDASFSLHAIGDGVDTDAAVTDTIHEGTYDERYDFRWSAHGATTRP